MQTKIKINPVKERIIFLSINVQKKIQNECCTGDFEKEELLGQGAFGRVFKVRQKTTGQIYALKQIPKKQLKLQNMVQQIQKEIMIMYQISHPNIIKLYDHFEEDDFIYLMLEHASGGQLWKKLQEEGRFKEDTVKSIVIQLLNALEYLHSRDPVIIHRDIKPENILLSDKGQIKLADFGWSSFFTSDLRTTYCGTLDYLAPEMILQTGHDNGIDIWSLGVLIYELLTGKAPFAPTNNQQDKQQRQKELQDNIIKVKIEFPNDFPFQAKDLVIKLLDKLPANRLKIHEIKCHSWIKENIAQQQQITDVQQQNSEEDNRNVQEKENKINEQKMNLPLPENKNLISPEEQQEVQEQKKLTVFEIFDNQKIKIQEDEIAQLQADNKQLWEESFEKDKKIKEMEIEFQKVALVKNDYKKVKEERNQFQEKIKSQLSLLEQKNKQILELQTKCDDLKTQNIKQQKEIEILGGGKAKMSGESSDNSQSQEFQYIRDLKQIMDNLNKQYQEFIQKNQKEQELTMKTMTLQKELSKLKAQWQNEQEEQLTRQQDIYEDEKQQIQQKFFQELSESQLNLEKIKNEYEEKINQLQRENIQKGIQDSEYQSLLKQLEIERLSKAEMRIDWENSVKLKNNYYQSYQVQLNKSKDQEEMIKNLQKQLMQYKDNLIK